MNIKTLLCALLFCATAQAADPSVLPYHPYRKVGEQTYNLQSLYQELANKTAISPVFSKWLIARESPLNHYTVMQVTTDGLLIEHTRTIINLTGNGMGPREETSIYFLTHYPFANSVIDGQKVAFIALRIGNHRYTDTQGATRTIEAYDYGVPYKSMPAQSPPKVSS